MGNKTKLLPELILGLILLVIGLYKMEENILLNTTISLAGIMLIIIYIMLNFIIKKQD